MANALRICFIQATNPVDVKWHAAISFGYLKAYTDRLFPGAVEYRVARDVQEAAKLQPHILGVSSTSQDFEEAISICCDAKAASIPIVVLGGFHITAFPETLPKTADVGVLSEGEATFAELVSLYLKNGCLPRTELSRVQGIVFRDESGRLVTTQQRPLLKNLDEIPLPDRLLGLAQGQAPYLFTSRGCPYHCSFCASSKYWPSVRYHGAERVIAEMEHILRLFPAISGISIWDDLFAADRARLRKVVELFEARGLNKQLSLGSSVRANLIDDELCGLLRRLNYTSIGFGAESGSDRILKKLKDEHCSAAVNQRALDTAHRNGLQGSAGFVLGHYDETEEDLLKTYEFILANYAAGKLAKHEITILTPMPGTALWNWAGENGFISREQFRWSSLRYLALYSNNLQGIDEWIALRERNGSMYLNDRNVPREHLYQIIRHYEDRIRRGNFTTKGPAAAETKAGADLPQYYLNRREEIIAAVPLTARNVLDVGCGGGMLGKALKERDPHCRVAGIELNPEAAAHAQQHLDAVEQADVESFDPPFQQHEFDCIVFADILEHLRDPWSIVKRYTQFLKPGGTLVASIPNVRYLGVLKNLLQHGTWEYADEGILDRTHLRFFTKKQFERLLHEAHIRVDTVRYLDGEQDVLALRPEGPDRTVRFGNLSLSQVTEEELAELRAFQIVFRGTYAPEPAVSQEAASPLMELKPADSAEVLYRYALKLAHNNLVDQAEAELDRLLAAFPEFALAHNDLGVLSFQRGDRDKARTHYEAAVRLEPRNATFLKNLADFTAVAEGRINDALALYQNVLALQPNDTEALSAVGAIAVALGREQEAALFFSKALQTDPGAPAVRDMIEATKVQNPFPCATPEQPHALELYRIGSFDEFRRYADAMKPAHAKREQIERGLIRPGDSFTVPGTCSVCNRAVDLHVDYFAAYQANGTRIPNWRERLLCPSCGLNNRLRASIQIFTQLLQPRHDAALYIAEQTTPLYRWLIEHFPNTVGSEFFGNDVPPGAVDRRGIRNENLTKLSFPDRSFDYILSFDVFEHVPDYRAAFRECSRTLKPGGCLFFSVPFDRNSAKNIIRAKERPDGTIEHLLPPEYHGDPLNRTQGCLCYQVFGWEMLDELKAAGFQDVRACLYWSRDLGYLGGDQIVFTASKASPVEPRRQERGTMLSRHPVPAGRSGR